MSDASRANGAIPGIGAIMPAVPPTEHLLANEAAAVASIGSEEVDVISLVEETLSVSKRAIVTGKVRVSTRTETYDDVAEVTLDRSVVDVTRVPIGREIDTAPAVRTEGDTTILSVIEERFVVVKQLYLKEELHIRRHVETEVSRIPVSLRRQTAVVERLDGDGRVPPDATTKPD